MSLPLSSNNLPVNYPKYTTSGGDITSQATQGSCLRNREPICKILKEYLIGAKEVFEVGTGTADQAAFFCKEISQITWQTSDTLNNHPLIQETIEKENLSKERLIAPVAFDIETDQIAGQYDAVYASNVVHTAPWKVTQQLFEKAASALKTEGLFILYGPYNVDQMYTSEGNEKFDKKLKAQDKRLGLRDLDDIVHLANCNGLTFESNHAMPSNNLMLIFKVWNNNH